MKTLIPFAKQSLTATIIVPDAKKELYRKMLDEESISIKEYTAQERGDDRHVFIVSGLSIVGINTFLSFPDVHIHYYELHLKNITACITMSSNKKYVEGIRVMVRLSEGKDAKTTTIYIYSKLAQVLDTQPAYYEVNWGGIGSVHPEAALNYADAIKVAATLAADCTAQFVKPI